MVRRYDWTAGGMVEADNGDWVDIKKIEAEQVSMLEAVKDAAAGYRMMIYILDHEIPDWKIDYTFERTLGRLNAVIRKATRRRDR